MKKYIAIVGADCPQSAISELSRTENIKKVLVLPPDDMICSPIATHPDTILCIFGNKLYCHEEYAKKNSDTVSFLCEECELTAVKDKGERNGKYPYDCAYNALVAGDKIIGNRSALCPALKELCTVNTKQGYAACGAAYAGAVITADPSISEAAEKADIEVFKIKGNDIYLKGYNTGFIGGATGYADGILFTVGDPESCESGRQLQAFCREKGVKIKKLCEGSLTDVGGIKFVKVK